MNRIIRNQITMGIVKEFREFALRGNLIDMGVAFVMGAAFNKVVSSFIDGIVMPLVGKMILNIDFSKLDWVIQEEVKQGGVVIAERVAVRVGHFIAQTLGFLIVAFVVFLVIKGINRLKRREGEKPALDVAPPRQEILLEEIRDLLKKNDRGSRDL